MPRASSLSGPAFQVLLALADGPLHGYALIQDIRARAGGLERLTPSTRAPTARGRRGVRTR